MNIISQDKDNPIKDFKLDIRQKGKCFTYNTKNRKSVLYITIKSQKFKCDLEIINGILLGQMHDRHFDIPIRVFSKRPVKVKEKIIAISANEGSRSSISLHSGVAFKIKEIKSTHLSFCINGLVRIGIHRTLKRFLVLD